MLTSLAVAVLWGGNLTAVFPVVDVIMNDQSLPEWIDQKIAESDREVADSQQLARAARRAVKATTPTTIEAASSDARSTAARRELADHIDSSRTGDWNDVQIAEKTRLDELHQATGRHCRTCPPTRSLGQARPTKKSDAEHQIEVYSKRAARFRWIAPSAHRWLPDDALRHADGRVPVRARVHAA